jgi:hypothetical protein
MTDDQLDQRLRDAARSYNAPPQTPREEMWARIEAGRRVNRRVYERLKKATRGKRLDADTFHQILTNLDLPPEATRELAGLTPAGYVGRAHISLGDD